MEKAIREISNKKPGCEEELNIVDSSRYVVTASKLMELKGSKCECGSNLCYDQKSRGTTLTLDWICSAGNKGKWIS